MSSRGVRVARGLAAAGFATFVAALFHVAGGGLPPSALALTLSLTFSGLACIALAGKRSSWLRLIGSVGISQFLFHALFVMSPSGHFAGPMGRREIQRLEAVLQVQTETGDPDLESTLPLTKKRLTSALTDARALEELLQSAGWAIDQRTELQE